MTQIGSLSAEQITAFAAVATAMIAAIAALTGAVQYWRSRSIAELEANLRLQTQINALTKKLEASDPSDQQARLSIAEDFLEICEIYAASWRKGSLPSLTREFIRDFLRYDLLPLVEIEPYKSIIRQDPSRPNHLKCVRYFAEIHGHRITPPATTPDLR